MEWSIVGGGGDGDVGDVDEDGGSEGWLAREGLRLSL